MIRLSQPWSLLVLLLFVFVFLRLRTFPTGSAVRRGVAWLCLGVALAGPEILWGSAPESVVLAVDVSSSASRGLREALGRLQGLIRGMPSVSLGVVAFGEKAHAVSPPGSGASEVVRWLELLAAEPGRVVVAGEQDETDIGAGLDLAGWQLLPGGGGRVILVTDGGETRGDARRAARDLASRGIAVDVLPVQGRPEHFADAAVEDVEAPGQVPQGIRFELRATIRSTVPGPAAVLFLEDGSQVARQDVLLSGGDTPVRFVAATGTPGSHRYSIRVALEGDQEPRNDVVEAAVMILGRPRVLWIGSAPPARPGLDVVHSAPGALADRLKGLGDFDAVVLSNVELDALPPGAPELLRHYVGSLGGGLWMMGGGSSFGPGGYRGTPVEEVLPVDLDAGSRAKRPRLALVLALDKSGSMAESVGALTKIAAAREAAMITVGLLESGDRFGLLSFDSRATTALPLQVPPGREELQGILARLEPAGGTRIVPALSEAAAMLAPFRGWRRHVVLVTDGRGEGGDFTARARQLTAAELSVSVIAVGDDADVPLLRALAAAGGGRFEFALDAGKLAAALRREVVLARGPVIHEARTSVLADPHPVLGEVSTQPIPPLFGYVSTAPKPFAAVPLRAETGDPVLALGSFGLGRTAALMTDLDGPWGAEWRGWAGGRRLLTQVLQWLLRAPVAGQVAIRQEPVRDGWALAVDARDPDGNRLNERVLVAHLHRAGLPVETVPLEQRGPGAYSGTLPSRVVGPASVIIEDRARGQGRIAGQGWIGLGYPEEHRLRGPNSRLLEEISQVSGGRALEKADSEVVSRPTRPHAVPLWPGLSLIGLGLVLLDLVLANGFGRPWRRVPAVPTDLGRER